MLCSRHWRPCEGTFPKTVLPSVDLTFWWLDANTGTHTSSHAYNRYNQQDYKSQHSRALPGNHPECTGKRSGETVCQPLVRKSRRRIALNKSGNLHSLQLSRAGVTVAWVLGIGFGCSLMFSVQNIRTLGYSSCFCFLTTTVGFAMFAPAVKQVLGMCADLRATSPWCDLGARHSCRFLTKLLWYGRFLARLYKVPQL